MRRRLLRTFIAVALFAVIVLGIPLGLIGRQLVRQDANRRADREADTVGFAVQPYLDDGSAIPAQVMAPFIAHGQYVTIALADGTRSEFGEAVPADAVETSIQIGHGVSVTLLLPEDDVDRRELLVVLFVAGLSAASVLLAALLGVLLARRLARPLDNLASVSNRLGDGDFTVRAARTGLLEVDAVASALDSCAVRIGAMVLSERQFSANASHQLRTPLTALRMRLEEIHDIGDGRVRVESDAALQQADRLEGTIADLLRLAREGSLDRLGTVDLAHLVRQHAGGWRDLCSVSGRQLVVDLPATCLAVASPGGAAQVLQTLIENGVHHGSGPIHIEVVGDGHVVAVNVSDEGRGVAAGDEHVIFDRHVSTNNGTGVGLALARTLAVADGGRLDLVRLSPPTFRLLYPAPGSATRRPSGEVHSGVDDGRGSGPAVRKRMEVG
jgi:signal transduction histidine kinase